MQNHDSHSFDLHARARRAMLEEGFAPDISPDAVQQLQTIEHTPLSTDAQLRDMRELLWSSIDNDESRDLDQVEVAERLENGDIRILVGIADVDARVPQNTPIDRHAEENTTSVYTGVETFPMLPEALSTDLTSLAEGEDRAAIIIEMVIEADGEVKSSDIYRALLRNHARLTYDAVGNWLESGGAPPDEVARVAGVDAQLHLQDEAADRLHALRLRQGMLDFETIEARPVVQDGQVVDLSVPHKNRAREIIENFMIAANTTMATFLESTGQPTIQRVVRSPERWAKIVAVAAQYGEELPEQPDARALAQFLAKRREADPLRFPDLSLAIVKLMGSGEYTVVHSAGESEGHFGLAVQNYTHSTAPNRRFPDLITQRLLKATLQSKPAPYSEDALAELAQHCTERENAARKVERRMRKVAAALLFRNRIGQVFDGIVTGSSDKGTYVRTLEPPVEGRVVQGEKGMDVGDKVRVRLIDADPDRGFIDFARAH